MKSQKRNEPKSWRVTTEYRAKITTVVEADSQDAAIIAANNEVDGNYLLTHSEIWDQEAKEVKS